MTSPLRDRLVARLRAYDTNLDRVAESGGTVFKSEILLHDDLRAVIAILDAARALAEAVRPLRGVIERIVIERIEGADMTTREGALGALYLTAKLVTSALAAYEEARRG